MSRSTLTRTLVLLLGVFALSACITPPEPFRAYQGSAVEEQLASFTGAAFFRQDWLNRYVDAVRFMNVNGEAIENSENINEILVRPGVHEITVYFSWDTGSQRGLAPALVDYAASRDTLSRTLRVNATAGRRYMVYGDPVFAAGGSRDITGLAYVDFWIEDEFGNPVVTREQGRYVPDQ